MTKLYGEGDTSFTRCMNTIWHSKNIQELNNQVSTPEFKENLALEEKGGFLSLKNAYNYKLQMLMKGNGNG